MRRAADAVVSWLAPAAPPSRAAIARTLVGAFATVYLIVRLRYFADGARHAAADFAPVGVCAILEAPLPPAATWGLALSTVALGIAFTAGRRLGVVGPAFFAGLLWTLSYASSWGKILHSENLLVLHVGVFALAGAPSNERAAGWALRAAAIATALTYAVAGVTKLRGGGVAWLSGDALGGWLAWDALRKIELGSLHSPLAARVAGSPALLQGLAIYTFVVELGAPLALASRRATYAWAALAWLFHVGILATMAIGFFYPISGVAFAPLLPLERIGPLRRLAGGLAPRA
ncbi:MAG: hypothetical protein KIS78_09865 [Labilithrix sp.]|nr:hypothetical protein [Labilithrix sp.]MCW5832703.1 hypothetical protein [Labilithrix sp.]